MRRLRYQVACSLDGYIAGPDDAFDWIPHEPTFDFEALYAQFDTLVMGRRTYEVLRASGALDADGGPDWGLRGKELLVASTTLDPGEHPGVEIVRGDLEARVRALRAEPGRDLWLYGGGALFARLLGWGLVDTVEPALLPILLGGGIPFLPSPSVRRRLRLLRYQAYPEGTILLEYEVDNEGDAERPAALAGHP